MPPVDRIPLDLVLDTPRCTLRAVSEEDVPFVWSATRFPGFNDGLRWNAPTDLRELVDACRTNLQAWKSGRTFTFTIVLKESGHPVGRIAIRADSEEGAWTIGFWIHPDHWGKGFAPEAARPIIEFGFTHLGAAVIRAAHATWNVRSKRVIEKLGMCFIRENPSGFRKNGKAMPEFEYALTKDEYMNPTPQPTSGTD
jgi:[ribosomal protein S5]-alanine N-acetyltransferase